MKEIGILLTIISGITWIIIVIIIMRVIKSEFFKAFSILRWHKKMFKLILVLTTLMLIFAFFGGKCIDIP